MAAKKKRPESEVGCFHLCTSAAVGSTRQRCWRSPAVRLSVEHCCYVMSAALSPISSHSLNWNNQLRFLNFYPCPYPNKSITSQYLISRCISNQSTHAARSCIKTTQRRVMRQMLLSMPQLSRNFQSEKLNTASVFCINWESAVTKKSVQMHIRYSVSQTYHLLIIFWHFLYLYLFCKISTKFLNK